MEAESTTVDLNIIDFLKKPRNNDLDSLIIFTRNGKLNGWWISHKENSYEEAVSLIEKDVRAGWPTEQIIKNNQIKYRGV